ncbi:MAG: sensor histidine kinase, partial [Methylocystis sp.]|nr:sensor histidine kinase [Methylocystis sp.]
MRLVTYLLVAQIAALVLAPLADLLRSISGFGLPTNMSLNDWGQYRVRDLVAGSLTRTADGAVHIEPTAALRSYAAQLRDFQYAVFEPTTEVALPGSSTTLVAALGMVGRIKASQMKFRLTDDPDETARGFLLPARTPFGAYLVAAYGYTFGWGDIPVIMSQFLTAESVIALSPMFLGVALISLLIVRSGLTPLHDAAAEVARIDMNCLNQRVPADHVPAEVAPFIDAVNAALARLDAGVAAQRRFTANAAHELRTPIAIMRAHADNPDDVSFRRDIRRDLRRLQTIVEQLLAAARFSAHEHPVDGSIDLGAAVLEIVADYTPLMIENRRRIEFEPPLSPTTIRCDRWALECVMVNLIDNALRSEPEGGVV